MAPPASAKLLLRNRAARYARLESAMKAHGAEQARMLKSSLRVNVDLRRVTQRILTAQEDARWTLSRGLRDEVGQILVAIGVRLVSLKQEARRNAVRLSSDIAGARVLAARTATSARRIARRVGKA